MSEPGLEELKQNLSDPHWRVTSGALYKIVIKGDGDGDEGLVVNFRPNAAQLDFMDELHYRSLILKSRQLGFSTLICILWLDTALFSTEPIRCAIIAQDKDAAESLFGKIRFAYDNLPEAMRGMFPLETENKSELVFAHNKASIKVATSVRGGTIHRLHISEFGKICAKYPDKAKEVVTGSLPAVPNTGIAVIESTAEGRDGHYYEMAQRAMQMLEAGTELSIRDWKFHFYPWMADPTYRVNPAGVVITDKDHEYFDEVEAKTGKEISMAQRAWYVTTRTNNFSGDPDLMRQEYPSTPEDAFHQSTEGCYYTLQMTASRQQGRIRDLPFVPSVPVNTFWDIGNSDGTAIWFHQKIGPEHRFIRFYEAWGEPYSHFVAKMQTYGYIWGRHYLPHDAEQERQGQESNKSPKQMLEDLGLKNIEIVPRVEDVNWGIQQTRDAFPLAYFDQTHCKEGLIHLEMYRKEWNERTGTWKNYPRHDVHSEGADSFRQFGQALANGMIVGVGGAGSGASAYKRKAVGGYKVR